MAADASFLYFRLSRCGSPAGARLAVGMTVVVPRVRQEMARRDEAARKEGDGEQDQQQTLHVVLRGLRPCAENPEEPQRLGRVDSRARHRSGAQRMPPLRVEAQAMLKDCERLIGQMQRALKKAPGDGGLAGLLETAKRERVVLLNYLQMTGGQVLVTGSPSPELSKHAAAFVRRGSPPIAQAFHCAVVFTTNGDEWRAEITLQAALEEVPSCVPGVPDVAGMRYRKFESAGVGASARVAFDTAEQHLLTALPLGTR